MGDGCAICKESVEIICHRTDGIDFCSECYRDYFYESQLSSDAVKKLLTRLKE